MTYSTPTPSKPSELPAAPPEDQSLIHPVSAVLLVAVDSLWSIAEWNLLAWAVTIPLSFLSVTGVSFLIQRFLKKDTVGKSLGVASFLGVLAAIPTPVTGTVVGAIALALAGIRKLR